MEFLPRGLHKHRFGPGASALKPKHLSNSKAFFGGCADDDPIALADNQPEQPVPDRAPYKISLHVGILPGYVLMKANL